MRENEVVAGEEILAGTVEEVGVRCPECGRSNLRVSRKETLSSVLLDLVGRRAFRCRGCRKRFFGPSAWAGKLPEKSAPLELALAAAATSAGSSSYFASPRAVVSAPVVPAPAPPAAAPAKRPPVLMLAAGSLVDLESLEVSARDVNGAQTFSLPGSFSPTRTRSPRPTFMVSGNLAEDLELYQLEVSEGRRVLFYALREQRVAFPAGTTIEPVWEGVGTVTPSDFLPPGEYALSPRSSDQFFLFGVD